MRSACRDFARTRLFWAWWIVSLLGAVAGFHMAALAAFVGFVVVFLSSLEDIERDDEERS